MIVRLYARKSRPVSGGLRHPCGKRQLNPPPPSMPSATQTHTLIHSHCPHVLSRCERCKYTDPKTGQVVEKDLWVTRKGATSAKAGQFGIIPGRCQAQQARDLPLHWFRDVNHTNTILGRRIHLAGSMCGALHTVRMLSHPSRACLTSFIHKLARPSTAHPSQAAWPPPLLHLRGPSLPRNTNTPQCPHCS